MAIADSAEQLARESLLHDDLPISEGEIVDRAMEMLGDLTDKEIAKLVRILIRDSDESIKEIAVAKLGDRARNYLENYYNNPYGE